MKCKCLFSCNAPSYAMQPMDQHTPGCSTFPKSRVLTKQQSPIRERLILLVTLLFLRVFCLTEVTNEDLFQPVLWVHPDLLLQCPRWTEVFSILSIFKINSKPQCFGPPPQQDCHCLAPHVLNQTGEKAKTSTCSQGDSRHSPGDSFLAVCPVSSLL